MVFPFSVAEISNSFLWFKKKTTCVEWQLHQDVPDHHRLIILLGDTMAKITEFDIYIQLLVYINRHRLLHHQLYPITQPLFCKFETEVSIVL